MQTENTFLAVENLSKSYKAEGPPVFDGINFKIEKGEFVCIIGHSGCGKTTILNVLAGLEDATGGYAYMLGREIKGPSLDRGVVFQGHALMPWMSVLQNVCFAVKSKYPDWNKEKIVRMQKSISPWLAL
jgi:nitrate/nitrite transport system ATP-binding protein